MRFTCSHCTRNCLWIVDGCFVFPRVALQCTGMCHPGLTAELDCLSAGWIDRWMDGRTSALAPRTSLFLQNLGLPLWDGRQRRRKEEIFHSSRATLPDRKVFFLFLCTQCSGKKTQVFRKKPKLSVDFLEDTSNSNFLSVAPDVLLNQWQMKVQRRAD